MRAFFVGRFQPYHLGHHEVVKNVLQKVDELIIGIAAHRKATLSKIPSRQEREF